MTTLPYAAVAAVLAALWSPVAGAACYMVYGPDGSVIYQSTEPPVDMSRQIHETLPRIAPGAVMVFSPSETGCEIRVNKLPLASAQRPGGGMRPPRADRG